MRIKLGQRYLHLSKSEFSSLVFIPLVACTLFVVLINLKPTYIVKAKLVVSNSLAGDFKKGSLKGLPKSLRRAIRASQKLAIASSQSSTQEKLAILKSKNLLSSFIKHHKLKQVMYPKRWDTVNKRWIKSSSNLIKRVFEWGASPIEESFESQRKSYEPKDYKALQLLSKKLKVKMNKKNGLITITLKWKDPTTGSYITKLLIDYANQFILNREQNIINDEIKNIEHLLKNENRPVNIKLLQEQIEQRKVKLSTAASQLAQPFKVIVPPKPPVEATLRFPFLVLFILWILSNIFTLIMISRNRYVKYHKAKELVFQ
ncbi:hypothetical protein [Aliikangiella coralliicola]|uniref:Polysaccharide chain length determinant N-terminal domain-containing protein n=1 Tax=Aliikangiella coralliicola TaxID=2592383 RepID=A0A545U7B1_9GAMM|nr:hypothetical protein [Aliikangiella coralliicola]TQV85355.1 hypothetical protein FLL46_19505 [Aliikangiella coralliicola]